MLDGEPLVVDAGVGTYTAQTFSADRFQIWTMRSAYHNVPFVADTEQAAGADHAATPLRCVDRADRAELALDVRGAYPDEAGIERWERSITLERDLGVVVADAWTLHPPAPVELHLLLRDEPAVDIDAGTLRYAGAVIAFDPVPARLELEPIPLDDPTLTSNWDRERLWRATAAYADASSGSVRTTLSHA